MPPAEQFIQFLITNNVLQFGTFTLKSGRQSPYFCNLGNICDGQALEKLGQYYAQAIINANIPYDMLFGPAYKGIPLVSATTIALSAKHQAKIPFSFDRKEAKTHGEGGNLVGAPLKGKVIVVDDVITAGTAIRHSANLIQQAGATLAGIVVALDRQEQDNEGRSALTQLATEYNIPVISVAKLTDLLAVLSAQANQQEAYQQVKQHHETYCS